MCGTTSSTGPDFVPYVSNSTASLEGPVLFGTEFGELLAPFCSSKFLKLYFCLSIEGTIPVGVPSIGAIYYGCVYMYLKLIGAYVMVTIQL